VTAFSDEDAARASLYALLARLFYRGPDAPLLARIAAAAETGPAGAEPGLPAAATGLRAAATGPPGAAMGLPAAGTELPALLAEAWMKLARTCAGAGEESALEYEDLFLGPGKAEVTLYLSHYWTAASRQRTLAELREDLASLGAARRPGAFEPEDHAAAMFDLMRLLASKSPAPDVWSSQQHVFRRYIAPAYPSLCGAISQHPAARFYRVVAGLCTGFLDLEARALG
jgi:TorA maturation chaperone TorD